MKQFSIMKIISLYFSVSFCFSLCFCGQLFMDINNSQYNISYNSSSSCNVIESSNVSNSVKCLMLCQMTTCMSLQFDASTNNCTLVGSNPSFIKYDSVAGLNLIYNLGIRYTLIVDY